MPWDKSVSITTTQEDGPVNETPRTGFSAGMLMEGTFSLALQREWTGALVWDAAGQLVSASDMHRNGELMKNRCNWRIVARPDNALTLIAPAAVVVMRYSGGLRMLFVAAEVVGGLALLGLAAYVLFARNCAFRSVKALVLAVCLFAWSQMYLVAGIAGIRILTAGILANDVDFE